MATLSHALLRSKIEHHTDLLHTLEEISLHQLNLVDIHLLTSSCPRLRILYLQNNLLSRIDRLTRLHQLDYVNLALNNLTTIHGLRGCEKLRKLDLTVNFIAIDALESSLAELAHNQMLRELYLTGNPCCSHAFYRPVVVLLVPQLELLDGQEVTRSERLRAQQDRNVLMQQLGEEATRAAAQRKPSSSISSSSNSSSISNRAKIVEITDANDEDEEDEDEDEDVNGHRTDGSSSFTPEARLKMYEQQKADEQAREDEKRKSRSEFEQPDLWKEAQAKLNAKAVEIDGKLPSQRNVGRFEFSITDDGTGNVVCEVVAPRFLDTSLIQVDVHPRWLQCVIKGKSLVVHTPHEVSPDRSKTQRIQANGHLLVIMPRVNFDAESARRVREANIAQAIAESGRKSSAVPSSSTHASEASRNAADPNDLADEVDAVLMLAKTKAKAANRAAAAAPNFRSIVTQPTDVEEKRRFRMQQISMTRTCSASAAQAAHGASNSAAVSVDEDVPPLE